MKAVVHSKHDSWIDICKHSLASFPCNHLGKLGNDRTLRNAVQDFIKNKYKVRHPYQCFIIDGHLMKEDNNTILEGHEDLKNAYLAYARQNLRLCSVDFIHSYVNRVIIKTLKDEIRDGIFQIYDDYNDTFDPKDFTKSTTELEKKVSKKLIGMVT